MNQRTKEQLLDYVLGALDAKDRAEVEQLLADRPQWRQELDQIKRGLRPLAEISNDVEPPADLARRTCSLVDSHVEAHRVCPASMGLTAAMQSESIAGGQGKVAEVVVAAGIFMALALLFFPAISNSRQLARLTQCHNNLRQLGLAMAAYSDRNSGGYFPGIPSTGNRAFAGIYGPMLRDAGYLVNSSLLICPSSRLADDRDFFEVPTLEQVDVAADVELVTIRRLAGGSYGYNLGYADHGVLRSPRNTGRSYFALMADAPSPSRAGYQSSNHSGRGRQNLLFEDGSIRYVSVSPMDDYADHPFRNHFGVVAAGVNDYDAVIAPSYMPPFIHFVSQ